MLSRGTKRAAAEGAEGLSKKPKVHINQFVKTDASEDDKTQWLFRVMDQSHAQPQMATKKLQEIIGTDPDEASDSDDDDAQLVAQALQMPSALYLREVETTRPDSPALSDTDTEVSEDTTTHASLPSENGIPASPAMSVASTEASEDTSAVASRPSENGIPAQEFMALLTPSTPQHNTVPDPHTPIGPQLYETARRATELVVDVTEDQMARVPATKRAVIRARMLADFTLFMHQAMGEFLNRLE